MDNVTYIPDMVVGRETPNDAPLLEFECYYISFTHGTSADGAMIMKFGVPMDEIINAMPLHKLIGYQLKIQVFDPGDTDTEGGWMDDVVR